MLLMNIFLYFLSLSRKEERICLLQWIKSKRILLRNLLNMLSNIERKWNGLVISLKKVLVTSFKHGGNIKSVEITLSLGKDISCLANGILSNIPILRSVIRGILWISMIITLQEMFAWNVVIFYVCGSSSSHLIGCLFLLPHNSEAFAGIYEWYFVSMWVQFE